MRCMIALLCCIFSALTQANPLPSGPHVYVEGKAELTVEPGLMKMAVTLEKVDSQLEAAKEDVDRRTFALLAALGKIGINDSEISSRQLRISPAYEYRREGRELLGTRVHREVEITLDRLDAYTSLIEAVTAADVSSISRTSFHAANENDVLARASEIAFEDARSRAERYAITAGVKLGRIHSISEFNVRSEESWKLRPSRGVGVESEMASPPPPYVTFDMSPGEPFVPGTLTAEVRVYVVYLLER